jgi:hypothetical protein
MDKLDLVYLPIVYVLRMTTLLFLLARLPITHFYDYWLQTCENSALRADLTAWCRLIFCHSFSFIFLVVHITLKLIVALFQSLPLWDALLFWPRFYWDILTNTDRRTFREMFMDPQYRIPPSVSRPPVSRITKRRFLAKNIVRIQPFR